MDETKTNEVKEDSTGWYFIDDDGNVVYVFKRYLGANEIVV